MTGWNPEQQEVLDSAASEENILVSAAAGSGKTAVMVERIVNAVVEGKARIDEILVVTFTKAAAAQMKAKIRKKLEERAEEKKEQNGRNKNLLGQLSLLGSAEITTIDSFCNHVVKEHFNAIGIDPVFDMMDSAEASLLKEDILEKLFSDRYQEDESFRLMVRGFSKRNHDVSELKSIIMKIARVADSFASPGLWLEEARQSYREDIAIGDITWVRSYFEDRKASVLSLKEDARWLLSYVKKIAGPEQKEGVRFFEGVIEQDLLRIDEFADRCIPDFDWSTVDGKKKWATFGETKFIGFTKDEFNEIKKYREKYKDALKEEILSSEKILSETRQGGAIVLFLIDLADEYQRRLLLEKKRVKRYEFNDIAHFAYQILCDETTGLPTGIGRDYAERFRYIYIDEYQDGNDLQEQILTSVSRRNEEGFPYNIFMVGDVKQSIYRFRLARPQLFMDKARTYHIGESEKKNGRLITLNRNYRSRKEILDATNFIFEKLMTEEFGRIPYDDAAKLYYPFEVDEMETKILPEIMMLQKESDEEKKAALSEEGRYLPDEYEAIAIAAKIRELIFGNPEKNKEPFFVENEAFDPNLPESADNPKKRPAKYRDIVILQRGIKGSHKMLRIYERFGIPVILDDPNGYFDAEEVITMLSVLSIIDNRMQDIPFASVLRSPIGGLTDNEMAWISLERKNTDSKDFCSVCEKFMELHPVVDGKSDSPIAVKVDRLLRLLDKWKRDRKYKSIPELMDEIYQDTEYDLFVSAMPNGKLRKANLESLKRKAEAFSGNGNQAGNLFLFLRYMEKCRIHEIEFAEPASRDSNEDAVHVCSIHSSKGLEYPIVIVARMGHEFNKGDYSSSVFVSPDYYVTANKFYFPESGKYIGRVKSEIRKAVADLEKTASRHEELRLLYVAMTRAKEKLILSGFTKDDNSEERSVTYKMKKDAKSYMDFVLAAIRSDAPNAEKYFGIEKLTCTELLSLFMKQSDVNALETEARYEKLKAEIEGLIPEGKVDQDPYHFVYAYLSDTRQRSKCSVSDIKKAVMENTKKLSELTIERNMENREGAEETEDERRPEQKKVSPGAIRGTLVHKVMELLPFTEIDSRGKMEACVDAIIKSDAFVKEDLEFFDARTREKIYSFYCDDENALFQRMKRAAMQTDNGRKDGKLFREQQFLTGIPADAEILKSDATNKDVNDATNEIEGTNSGKRKSRLEGHSEEIVTIQGIVDAFFFEKDEEGKDYIVLVDYKTDRVDSKEELILHYRAQMEIYADTIARILNMEVRERILYGLTNHIGEVRV